MGGYPNISLGSHKRDDRDYHRKRRELKKYIPALKNYLDANRSNSRSDVLVHLKSLYEQLTDHSIRVPMHVLLRGEDLLRRNVLGNSNLKHSIMEVIWRSTEFRLAIAQRIEETIVHHGNCTQKTSKEMESLIYRRARTKNEYLESAARILLYIRDRSQGSNDQSTSAVLNDMERTPPLSSE